MLFIYIVFFSWVLRNIALFFGEIEFSRARKKLVLRGDQLSSSLLRVFFFFSLNVPKEFASAWNLIAYIYAHVRFLFSLWWWSSISPSQIITPRWKFLAHSTRERLDALSLSLVTASRARWPSILFCARYPPPIYSIIDRITETSRAIPASLVGYTPREYVTTQRVNNNNIFFFFNKV